MQLAALGGLLLEAHLGLQVSMSRLPWENTATRPSTAMVADRVAVLGAFCCAMIKIYLGSALAFLRHSISHGAHAEAGPSIGNPTMSNPGNDDSGDPGESNSRKRKRKDKGKGKGKGKANGDEDLESTAGPSNADDAKPKLACPFFRFNPFHYFECASHDLADYEAVRTHIKRKHMGSSDFYCAICYGYFDSASERDAHLRRTGYERCISVRGHDQITNAEWSEAGRCPRTSNCETKWLWLWDNFFKGLPRPSVYLEDIVVEAKRVFLDLATIQSVLVTHLPLNQLDPSTLAARVHEALMRANSGARQYRVDHDAETNPPAVPEAELLRPIAEHLALSSQQASPAPYSKLATEGRGGRFSHSILHPPLIPPQLGDPSSNDAGFSIPFNTMAPLAPPSDWEALLRSSDGPLSWENPNGPKWSDVLNHVDWGAFRQSLNTLENPPMLFFLVPILPGRLQRFIEIPSREAIDPPLTGGGHAEEFDTLAGPAD